MTNQTKPLPNGIKTWQDIAMLYGIDETASDKLVKRVDSYLEASFNAGVLAGKYVEPVELCESCINNLEFTDSNEMRFALTVALIYTFSNVIMRITHDANQVIDSLQSNNNSL
jgi:hypothetical protein